MVVPLNPHSNSKATLMPADFSVIIPSRNRQVLPRRAIDSVLGQTHGSVEVIVINDGPVATTPVSIPDSRRGYRTGSASSIL